MQRSSFNGLFVLRLKRMGQGGVTVLSALLLAFMILQAVKWVSPLGAMVWHYKGINFDSPVWCSSENGIQAHSREPTYYLLKNRKFSTRWNTWLHVPASTNYTFASLCEGGIRVYIDENLIIDGWNKKGFYSSGKHVDLMLSEGMHALRVEYFNDNRESRMRLEWEGGPIPPRTIVGGSFLMKRVKE